MNTIKKKAMFVPKNLKRGTLLIVTVLLFAIIFNGCTKLITEYFVSLGVNKAEAGKIRFENSPWAAQLSKTVNKGADINLYAATETGYLFNGWYENGTRVNTVSPYTTTVNSVRNIQATFRKESGLTAPEMALLNTGTFQMGDEYSAGVFDELPVHTVTMTKEIYMGKYEITNAQFVVFLNQADVLLNGVYGEKNGRRLLYTVNNVYSGIGHNGTDWYVKTDYNGANLNYAQMPVVYVTWFGAVEYCNWLSEDNGLAKAYIWDADIETYRLHNYPFNEGYRLPTEAEWEYTARGGQNFKWAGTSDEAQLGNYAWCYFNSDVGDGTERHVQAVDQKISNGYGLKDMTGNASEWCSDNWYTYTSMSQSDPYYLETGIGDIHAHIIRGGSFGNASAFCRVAGRNLGSDLGNYYDYVGFRVARNP